MKTRLFVLALSIVLFTGCGVYFRHPANHALMQARLPRNPQFKDVVFHLQDPPKVEMAFLLAQTYPDSYVVCSLGSYIDYLYLGETKNRPQHYGLARLAQGDTILRKEGLFKPRRRIPVELRTLENHVVFHKMKAASFAELPPVFTENAIQINWSEELPPPPSSRSDYYHQNSWFAYLGPLTVPVAFGMVGWTAIAPPIPDKNIASRNSRQILAASLPAGEGLRIDAREKCEKGFYVGALWAFPLMSFFNKHHDESYKYLEDPWSPGGWADCLEQLFRHPRIFQTANAVEPSTSSALDLAFLTRYKDDGYVLEPMPPSDPDNPYFGFPGKIRGLKGGFSEA